MSFMEIEFDTSLALQSVGGPGYSTNLNKAFGGFEQGNQNWSQSLGEWTVSFEGKRQDEFDRLLSMFHAARGMANRFRLFDHSDYFIKGGFIGTGDGTTRTFQLQKIYSFPLTDFQVARPIQKPITSDVVDLEGNPLDDTVALYLDGSPETHWTVDETTGIVTFDSGHAPTLGQVITADAHFHVPVRFDLDQFQKAMLTPLDGGILYTVTGVKLVEVRIALGEAG